LSPAGVRSAFDEAIQRARETDVLGPLASAVDQPGFRRRTLARFASWIRRERRPEAPPPGKSPSESALWALFGHFSETLDDIGARTPEGWTVWASKRLTDDPPTGWRDLGETLVAVVEPVAPTEAIRRAIDFFRDRAGAMVVTLPYDAEPTLGEVYAAIEPTRRYFLEGGFTEATVPAASTSPPGLTEIDRELFRSDSHLRSPFSGVGLRILGGPRGEGEALLIARRVLGALEGGTDPGEILILVPKEDDAAASIRSTLGSWGIPVAPGPDRRLATTPAVSALRLAIRLPVDDWDVAGLSRLLRNGAIDWPRLGLGDGFRRFEAANAICSTRVYRNRDKLRTALDRTIAEAKVEGKQAESPKIALDAINRLSDRIDRVVRSGPWRAHLDRLQTLASDLGLNDGELAPLWDAIEDHAWVLDQVGAAIAAIPLRWAEFVDRVERIIADAEPIPANPADRTGTVRVEVIGAVDAARASVVIVANLAEKTFPTPDSVPLDPTRSVGLENGNPVEVADPDLIDVDPAETPHTNLAYAREMLRFLRAIGSADDALTLVYPTTDSNGESLLPAGFLDEILRRLDPAAFELVVETHARFDPVLRGHEDLALSRGDARVLAVAKACGGDLGPVRRLAEHPDHDEALRGVAEAFRIGHLRRERFDFNAHDGWLMDLDAVAKITETFGPKHPFSPSQLESYALCPFQFFQRYVLGLKAADSLEELAEDYAGRGRDVHKVLEDVHLSMIAEGTTHLATRLPIMIETTMRAELDRFDRDVPPGEADVAEVLREIDTRRSGKALERYLAQFRAYDSRGGANATPDRFEVNFGQPDKPDPLPALTLGEGDRAIQLQGVIDRIDLISSDGETRFRVIDYKTGSNPSPADVKSGLASQLPLYAMAVEQLVLSSGEVAFLDAGYWSLPKDGFRAVKLDAWDDYRGRLTRFILAMVGELRRGVFPVFSQKKDCEAMCDFHKTCRVREVRGTRKAWNDRPTLEVE